MKAGKFEGAGAAALTEISVNVHKQRWQGEWGQRFRAPGQAGNHWRVDAQAQQHLLEVCVLHASLMLCPLRVGGTTVH